MENDVHNPSLAYPIKDSIKDPIKDLIKASMKYPIAYPTAYPNPPAHSPADSRTSLNDVKFVLEFPPKSEADNLIKQEIKEIMTAVMLEYMLDMRVKTQNMNGTGEYKK